MAESACCKLVEYLNDLEAREFKMFKFCLENYPLEDGYKRIPRSKTEAADTMDIARAMVQAYQEPRALQMAVKILDGISRKDLSQRIQNDMPEVFCQMPEPAGVSEDDENDQEEELISDMCGTKKKVEVKLDPNTAFPTLLISQDQKSVRLGDRPQYLPNNSERFDFRPCVLGAPGITRGQLDWVVDVGAGKGWIVGAARESVERKGHLYITAEQGFWGLEFNNGEYQALSTPNTTLFLRAPLRRIKVHLDYIRGQLSFYDTMEHIFTFNYPFSEKMFPFFLTWDTDVPLQLCPCD
ncbi:E3 ubiquitin-protein ligase TRIM7-like [Mauremys reevesii]|uniref:E3 ubiquitin-protein ligase TRIM7-like n=1 Tax=Mauremys reevesii TaxID=260615 RepID=UPI00193FEDD9|nr:E3 ubiquitin-protein ligase TRIM7-like [Mauremys reevesii]XP_039365842.1 E3 ubiquitin-protein ligase TRIM7-like [Mauremys reevesii]